MSDVDRLVRQAETLIDLGRPAEAEQRFRDALAMDPESTRVLVGLAQALHQQGQNPEAMELVRRATAQDPESIVAAVLLCDILCALDDAHAAREAAARCIHLAPTTWESHYVMARALLAGRKPKTRDAYDAARRAVSLAPHSPSAHNLVGMCLADLGNHAGAELAYRHALSLDPHHTFAQNNLAASDLDRGKLSRAAQRLRTAVGNAPQEGVLHENLDNVLRRLCLRLLWVLLAANLSLGLLLILDQPWWLRSFVGAAIAVGGVWVVRRFLAHLPGDVSQWGRGLFRRSPWPGKYLLALDVVLVAFFVLLAFAPHDLALAAGFALVVTLRVVGAICIVGWILSAVVHLFRGT